MRGLTTRPDDIHGLVDRTCSQRSCSCPGPSACSSVRRQPSSFARLDLLPPVASSVVVGSFLRLILLLCWIGPLAAIYPLPMCCSFMLLQFSFGWEQNRSSHCSLPLFLYVVVLCCCNFLLEENRGLLFITHVIFSTVVVVAAMLYIDVYFLNFIASVSIEVQLHISNSSKPRMSTNFVKSAIFYFVSWLVESHRFS
jgi:hypothetical protein